MTDGTEVKVKGRWVRVSETQGHTIVTYIDAQHIGYMFSRTTTFRRTR